MARKYTAEQELKAVRMKLKGASTADVVAATGVHERSVWHMMQRFKKMFKDLENVDEYEMSRSKLLSSAEFTVLKSLLSEDKIASARLGELSKAFHVLHTSNRLERGLSTSNIESKSFTEVSTKDFK